MENSNKNFNVVFTLLFIGMLLSFGIYFFMTTAIRPSENLADNYFSTTKNVREADFTPYDNACLKSKKLQNLIIKTEYRLFGNIRKGNIIKGRHEFLFPAGQNELGYDYVVDHFGGYRLSEEQLENFYRAISIRKEVYEKQNRHYVLAVIPNSQTVYSEYLPTYLGDSGDRNTILSQISAYMESHGGDFFLDLSDQLRTSKSKGQIYNNTENSINALGAYYVYSTIIDNLSESLIDGERKLSIDDFEYYTHLTDGKALAKEVGLDELIKNETVSISNSNEFMYTVVDYAEGIETTYTKSAYRDKVSLNPYVLIECKNEWDKIQLMPYFSSTFGVSSYKTDLNYDREAIRQSNPLIVIQVIHEDQLSSLLSDSSLSGYSEALKEDSLPYQTKAPEQVQYAILDDKNICITGTIENDAEISVFGDGFETITAKGLEGRFFIKVRFNDSVEGHEVFLSSKAPDKAVSSLTTLLIEGVNNVGSARDVAVGENSMLYKSNYDIPMSLPDDEILAALSSYLSDLFRRHSLVNSTKVLFATLPEKLSVYTEGLPSELLYQSEQRKLITSLFEAILHEAGATVPNLKSAVLSHMNNDKMYYQTSDNFTDIAYYYMYCEIANALGFQPLGADSILEYSAPFKNGELAASLGFNMTDFAEVTTRFKYAKLPQLVTHEHGALISYIYGSTKPRAIIVCDEKSAPLAELLAYNFSVTYVIKTGNINISEYALYSILPDYVIYLCDEGKIDFMIR